MSMSRSGKAHVVPRAKRRARPADLEREHVAPFGIAERVHLGRMRLAARGRDPRRIRVVDDVAGFDRNRVQRVEHRPVAARAAPRAAPATRPAAAVARAAAATRASSSAGSRRAPREPRLEHGLQLVRRRPRRTARATAADRAARRRAVRPSSRGIDVGGETQANRRAGIGVDDHVDLGVARRMSLHGQAARRRRAASAAAESAAVALHELCRRAASRRARRAAPAT